MLPDDPRHGTTRGFHAGCRDLCCRRAINRYEKQGKYIRRHGGRAVPAIGAQRRIQALLCLGWTMTDIADAAGWKHRNHVRRILVGQKGKPTRWLERKTHDAIARVFDDLCMTLPEREPHRLRTATIARRKGYLPPLMWDDIDNPHEQPGSDSPPSEPEPGIDEAVVLRILAGDLVPATVAERARVAELWWRSGRPLADLERLTGWQVNRYWKASA